MRKSAVLATVLLAGGLFGPANGGEFTDFWRPMEIGGSEIGETSAYMLAHTEQVITLVRAVRNIEVAMEGGGTITRESDLRVSLVVLDLGPSTDVSPRAEIHLAMFNDINETGVAWALVPIISAWEFHGVKRTAPGIYVVDATVMDGTGGAECFFQRADITIDARDLSVIVRQARGMEEFADKRYRGEVAITTKPKGCNQ